MLAVIDKLTNELGRDHERRLLERQGAEHFIIIAGRRRRQDAPLGEVRQRRCVEVEAAARRDSGGGGDDADGALVVAALVPAQRLTCQERLLANGALVHPAASTGRGGGCGRRWRWRWPSPDRCRRWMFPGSGS
jgi:hypothetical protein